MPPPTSGYRPPGPTTCCIRHPSLRPRLLDSGYRRVLVDAPPREATPLIPADQILQGNARLAEERIRAGGWAVVSQGLAEEQHLHIGQAFTPPPPDPLRLR